MHLNTKPQQQQHPLITTTQQALEMSEKIITWVIIEKGATVPHIASVPGQESNHLLILV